MKKLAHPDNKNFPYVIVIAYVSYVVLFWLLYNSVGVVIGTLAIIPVVGASWYYGFRGGLFVAVLCVLNNIIQHLFRGISLRELLFDPANTIDFFILIFTSFVVGNFKVIVDERIHAFIRLEHEERNRQFHTDFLELLSQITAVALEADNLEATLQILVEKIGGLFEADDCFLDLWDETKSVPIPTAAYGLMSDIYSSVQFESGERTPTTFAIESGQPVAITDLASSPDVDSQVAAIFLSQSMLALPLIVQNRKLGALLIGYKQAHASDENELVHAALTAEQVALVLSKSLLLEEERKQVRQLTLLHDVALILIDADNEDELIQRVTAVIRQTLSLDHFGILLLDEQAAILRSHSSYYLRSPDVSQPVETPLSRGITGQVVRTGKARRIGNVRSVEEYLDVDERTVSELCVPIKFKEHILGAINAESAKWNAFTEDDERLLVTLAGQIATALEQIHKAQTERRWLDQLVHSNELIYALAQITTHIEKALSSEDIIQSLGLELSKIHLTCIMAVYDKAQDLFTVNYTSLEPPSLETLENSLGFPLINHTFSPDKLSTQNLSAPLEVSDPVDEFRNLFATVSRENVAEALQQVGIGPQTEPLWLPLIFEENLLGVLWIWGDRLTGADLPIMSIFAKQIGTSLERARLFQEVQSLALTDPLTGLRNRRSLFELGKVEFSRAHRMKRSLCCMMLDLDHFKRINDTYGHPAGDQVLREFANRCKCSVRGVDLVGRYGGEEIVILLPETDGKTAIQIAERLRLFIAAAPFKITDREVAVTVSIGIATLDPDTLHLETLIDRADQAMYIAKRRGRNCVVMSESC